MSNHSGSYMINDILKIMLELKMFENISQEDKKVFFEKIWEIVYKNDCNVGEVLECIGKQIGVCYYCHGFKSFFEEDMCVECCTQLSQLRIKEIMGKYEMKENLINLYGEDPKNRRYYYDLYDWDTCEMALMCYEKGYTEENLPVEYTDVTEYTFATLLTILRQTKEPEKTLETLQDRGGICSEIASRRLYADLDLENRVVEEHTKQNRDTVKKALDLIRNKSFWKYWCILNIHILNN